MLQGGGCKTSHSTPHPPPTALSSDAPLPLSYAEGDLADTYMPDELLDTMPPIMLESMDEGSGPILYWMGSLFTLAWLARIRLTSPPISPGSTVIRLPSP